MNLFRLGNFKLASGSTTAWKIDCDALTDDDWEALAFIAHCRLPDFSTVSGVPNGGLRFAEKLQRYCKPNSGRHLIADDVLTTGSSMEWNAVICSMPVIGVVVFARGPCPDWVTPLFQMPACSDAADSIPFVKQNGA